MSITTRAVLGLLLVFVLSMTGSAFAQYDYTVKLRTGEFVPSPTRTASPVTAALADRHAYVQFDAPVTDDERERLADDGIHLLTYIPNLTYVARVEDGITTDLMREHGIRWVDRIQPVQKIDPSFSEYGIFEWAQRPNGRAQMVVVLHPDEDAEEWMDRFATDFDAEIIGHEPSANSIDLVVSDVAYYRFSEFDGVAYIEQGLPEPREHNDDARVNIGAETLQMAPWNLSGNNVTLAEWDGGQVYALHIDFGGRVESMDGAPVSDHATHVAGTVMGDGASSSGALRGMAPAALLKSYLWWGSGSEASSEYTFVINQRDARASTNSWGYGPGDPASPTFCSSQSGIYTSTCTTLDNIVRGSSGAPIVIAKSAGNARSHSSDECGSLGWVYGTVIPWETAKNLITVGAINADDDAMTSFSSYGPCADGRLKPDVVGPGCKSNGGITSCKAGGGYWSACGTSMSTPAVAGVVALMFEQWDNTIGTGTFLPSTVKGILINTADDLGAPGPDYAYGHGKVDGVEAVEKISFGDASYVVNDISTGTTHIYDLTVPGNTDKLKVTLVWDDPGGTSSASQHLVNDLDLVLEDPSTGEEFPWILDGASPTIPATKGVDHINNVETVELDSPTPGLWKAKVTGFNVPSGPQTYSLVFTPNGISTPGNLAALAVFDDGDLEAQPDDIVDVEFWVANVGAGVDTVSVDISDNGGWLTSTITDSQVVLGTWDSAYFSLQAVVPTAALAGEYSSVTCQATSQVNPDITAQKVQDVVTGAYYGLTLSVPPIDTAASPDTIQFSFTVSNTGNDTDLVTFTPTDDSGWTMIPTELQMYVDPKSDSTVTFEVGVPAEVPDGAVNTVVVDASSGGGVFEQTSYELHTSNPTFPPSLDTPDGPYYTQEDLIDFTWTGTGDSYNLYIARDTLVTNPVHVYTGIMDLSFSMPPGDELENDAYFWAVRLYSGPDSSSLQRSSRKIVVDTIPPVGLVSREPSDGDNINTLQPQFEFNFADLVIYPDWEIAPDQQFIKIAQDSQFTAGVQLLVAPEDSLYATPPAPLAEGYWYWQAYNMDMAGNSSDTTPTIQFLLDSEVPMLPVLLSPLDGKTVGGDTIVLDWQGSPPVGWDVSTEYYYLHVSKLANFSDYTFTGYVYDDQKAFPGTTFDVGQEYFWRVKAWDSAGNFTEYTAARSFTYAEFLCGDVDDDGQGPDLGDILYLANALFLGGPPVGNQSAGDVNCDTILDLADILAMASRVFLGGDPLCCE